MVMGGDIKIFFVGVGFCGIQAVRVGLTGI